MSEIARWDGGQEVATLDTAQDRAVHRLTEWARSADAAYQIAEKLVQSSFVPDGFRGKPVEATAAILAGLEVGLQPMAALRSFDVIQGQAAPRAMTLRAIVQSFGHEIILEESTASRCRMRGRRKGTAEWVPVTWTLDRAKQLGVTNKSNWKSQPQSMLVARATSELARLIAADAILGLGYSAEEVADGGPAQEVTAQTVDPTPTGTRKMSRRKAEPEPDSEPDGITSAQSKKLHAAFNDLGITERNSRLAYVGDVIGRPVGTSNELTKDEASRVIDALESEGSTEVPTSEPPTDDADEAWKAGQ